MRYFSPKEADAETQDEEYNIRRKRAKKTNEIIFIVIKPSVVTHYENQ